MSDVYRIPRSDKGEPIEGMTYDDMAKFLIDEGYLVEAEATDSICFEHNLPSHARATSCVGHGTFEWWRDCVMVDVVRMEDSDG